MLSILKAADIPEETLRLVGEVVKGCRICRLWQRPGTKSATSSHIATRFNEVVQVDILFVRNQNLLHMIDESIRWTAVAIIPDRREQTVLHAISKIWIKLFGPMKILKTDQEGAIAHEAGAIFCEHHGIHRVLLAVGQHASHVERHHEILRQLINKIHAQSQLEGIPSSIETIVDEAVFAKNALTQIGGETPYRALLGRTPNLLTEFQEPTISQLQDTTKVPTQGTVMEDQCLNSQRIREIALKQMVEASAWSKTQRALSTKSRTSAEELKL